MSAQPTARVVVLLFVLRITIRRVKIKTVRFVCCWFLPRFSILLRVASESYARKQRRVLLSVFMRDSIEIKRKTVSCVFGSRIKRVRVMYARFVDLFLFSAKDHRV